MSFLKTMYTSGKKFNLKNMKNIKKKSPKIPLPKITIFNILMKALLDTFKKSYVNM